MNKLINENDVVQAVHKYLEEQGFEVESANTKETGIDIFANKNDEVDTLLKTIKNPTTTTSDILTDKIDEVNQSLETSKEIEKENATKLDASEAAIKIKQESAELESDYTLFQEVSNIR